MTFAVSALSEISPRSRDPRNAKTPPGLLPAQDRLVAASVVIAVVFASSLGATRSATIGASVAAAVAILAAAQVASSAVIIGNEDNDVLPPWIDLLRLVGVALAVLASVVTINGHLRGVRVETMFLVPGLTATATSILLLVTLAATTSQDLTDSFLEWLLAAATITLPLSAALIWWSTVFRSQRVETMQPARMAVGWTCLAVVLAGSALDRVLQAHHVSPHTNWSMLPAAALLSTTAISVVEGRLDRARGSTVTTADASAEAEIGPRNWIREAIPYVSIAVAAAAAMTLIREARNEWWAIFATASALMIGTLILVRQVAIHTSNARAAHRLERAGLELATQARVDPVTGLPNRRALDDRLAEEVERALRYKQPSSLCFVDLDHFKSVNDDHGHGAGDDALREVGSVLRRTARGIDFVGRFGGEEFVVLVPGTWSEDAATLGERLRRAVAENRFDIAGNRSVRPTISKGVAGLPEHALDPESLSQCGDSALYNAKRAGRDRVVLFEPGP